MLPVEIRGAFRALEMHFEVADLILFMDLKHNRLLSQHCLRSYAFHESAEEVIRNVQLVEFLVF